MFFNEKYIKPFVIERMRSGMDGKTIVAELVRQFGYAHHVARRLTAEVPISPT